DPARRSDRERDPVRGRRALRLRPRDELRRFFDVRSVPDPVNLADTNLGLGVHTDNPYRDPVPTLQLLHCLIASGEGGDTVLVDGFHAVEQLRRRSPRAFELLADVPVRYEYESAVAVLRS